MPVNPAYRYLPPRARTIADQIGVDALYRLTQWRGGVTIYVPSRARLKQDHELVSVIGWDAAQALADDEGRKLEIPFCSSAQAALTQMAIREYRLNHSERDTALHFTVSERWVRHLMATGEQDEQQDDFFSEA